MAARYQALIPEIYIAEMQRDIAKIIYPNLQGIEVRMPHNIVNLGEGAVDALPTNLDILSSFAAISVMQNLEGKTIDKLEKREAKGKSVSRAKN